VAEESTELVDVSSDELISRQLLMTEEGEDDGDLPIVEFDAATRMTPIVRHGGPGIELAQPAEGGSMSGCDLCIASFTPNSLP
jgi:hypothetical protein